MQRFHSGTGSGAPRWTRRRIHSWRNSTHRKWLPLLAEYGRRSALRGGNPYRSKAYLRAAENLAALAEPLERIVEEGRLREIPGVGDAIADIICQAAPHRHPSLAR